MDPKPAAPAKPRATRPKKKRRAPGWVPDHHGAWGMIIIPPFIGAILGGWRWQHIFLFLAWWAAYFLFYAGSLWLTARRRPRYWPPVKTYGLITAALGALAIATNPFVLRWAPVYLPLIAVTAYLSWQKKSRSFLNDFVTVLAASVMTAVSYDVSTRGDGGFLGRLWDLSLPGHSPVNPELAGWRWAWLVTAIVTAYFVGTIFYVKTNIRERGNTTYIAASIIFHAAIFAAVVFLASDGAVRPIHAIIWSFLLARAISMALISARRDKPVRPRIIGIGEIIFSLLVPLTLML